MADNLLERKQARFNHLDLYKGIAIQLVIITHSGWEEYRRLQLLFPFWVDMAVPIFMVITGYVSAMSFDRKDQSLKDAVSPKEILCKWLRLVLPYIPIYMIQTFVRIVYVDKVIDIKSAIKQFIIGGQGPGSYYFTVMIQVAVIMPIIWYVVKKYKFRGLVGCFAANVFFEIAKTMINMKVELYRLISFRYIFILAFGCYLYYAFKENHDEKNYWYYIAGTLGIAYIIAFRYTSAEPIITTLWKGKSVFAVLYIVPIMKHLMKPNQFHNSLLELLGKASFNICLVQVFYFWIVADCVYQFIPTTLLRTLVNIVICCFIGVLYYRVESPVTQRIIKAIRGWRI